MFVLIKTNERLFNCSSSLPRDSGSWVSRAEWSSQSLKQGSESHWLNLICMSSKVKYIPDYFMKSFWKFCVLSFDIFKKNLVELLDLMLLSTLFFFFLIAAKHHYPTLKKKFHFALLISPRFFHKLSGVTWIQTSSNAWKWVCFYWLRRCPEDISHVGNVLNITGPYIQRQERQLLQNPRLPCGCYLSKCQSSGP